MTGKPHQLILPDLGLDERPVTVSLWLASAGQSVIEGESILEIAAGDAIIELPAPANGVLAEQLVEEEERVQPGQLLGVVIAE